MKILKQINRPVRLMAAVVLLLFSFEGNAQTKNETTLIGTWELRGTLLGDDGAGALLPHKSSNPDCQVDYTVFDEDYSSKEVRFDASCASIENTFNWSLEGNNLTLTKGNRSIDWLIHSLSAEKLIVGVRMRPDAEKRMFVVYEKRN